MALDFWDCNLWYSNNSQYLLTRKPAILELNNMSIFTGRILVGITTNLVRDVLCMQWQLITGCAKHKRDTLFWEQLGKSTLSRLQWRQNDHDGVSNHQPHGCLLNRLFRRRPKKTLKLRVTGLCAGNSPGPVNSPHKGPVTRKLFPFDGVIMRERRLAGAEHSDPRL